MPSHADVATQKTQANKKKMCQYYQQGTCQRGRACCFSHGNVNASPTAQASPRMQKSVMKASGVNRGFGVPLPAYFVEPFEGAEATMDLMEAELRKILGKDAISPQFRRKPNQEANTPWTKPTPSPHAGTTSTPSPSGHSKLIRRETGQTESTQDELGELTNSEGEDSDSWSSFVNSDGSKPSTPSLKAAERHVQVVAAAEKVLGCEMSVRNTFLHFGCGDEAKSVWSRRRRALSAGPASPTSSVF